VNAPDWYPDWKHDAVHQLMDKQEILDRDFKLNQWPRWDYDIDTCSLTFSENGIAKVVAEIQIVGTTGSKDWMWGLANDHWPDAAVLDMEAVWQFGIDNGIEELATKVLVDDDLNALGWAMSAVSARVLDAAGAYRPKSDSDPGAIFLLIKSIRHAEMDS